VGFNVVPRLAMLALCAAVGVAAHQATGPHAVAPAPVVAPPVVTAAPAPPSEAPALPALAQIAIPVPPVVTGLPYPAHCTAVGKLPDPSCTPGSVNPAVTQDTIGSTICKSGWTATVRPPASDTAPVKRAAMKAYGIPASASGTTELDHLVPLEAGGSDDSSNLWSEVSDEPGHGFNNSKDLVENRLKAAVCSHQVTLAAAQAAIAADWTTAEQTLGITP
jgi:hypothetical protein